VPPHRWSGGVERRVGLQGAKQREGHTNAVATERTRLQERVAREQRRWATEWASTPQNACQAVRAEPVRHPRAGRAACRTS
jgi:hypothetical protein